MEPVQVDYTATSPPYNSRGERLFLREVQPLVISLNVDRIAFLERAAQNLQRQRVVHDPLDGVFLASVEPHPKCPKAARRFH
jgi:hypothetical protein